ncbi:MAG: hypothetical protein PVF15_03425 [Candidatus Bathyarchaeota archaeon]
MVECPECGEPLAKSKSRRYYCENERCFVIYVQRPHHPAVMKIIRKTLPKEDGEKAAP